MFKRIECREMEGSVILSGQLRRGAYDCRFPSIPGQFVYEITVIQGKIRFNHASFDPDGGKWSMPPGEGQQAHYTLRPGQPHTIELTSGSSYHRLGQVEAVNPNLFYPARFEYRITAI